MDNASETAAFDGSSAVIVDGYLDAAFLFVLPTMPVDGIAVAVVGCIEEVPPPGSDQPRIPVNIGDYGPAVRNFEDGLCPYVAEAEKTSQRQPIAGLWLNLASVV